MKTEERIKDEYKNLKEVKSYKKVIEIVKRIESLENKFVKGEFKDEE